jgi:hypothetical protein
MKYLVLVQKPLTEKGGSKNHIDFLFWITHKLIFCSSSSACSCNCMEWFRVQSRENI